MPDMSILEFVSKSMPFAVFALIILNVIQTTLMFIMWKMIASIKQDVVWVDRFEEFKENVVDRVESLERVRNGT